MIVVMVVFAALMGLAPAASPRICQAAAAALIGLAGLYLAVSVGLKFVVTQAAMKKLMSRNGSYTLATKAYRRGEALVRSVQAGGIVLLLLLGATDAMRQFWLMRAPLACESVVLGLFFASLVLCWRIGYRFDRACRMQVEQDLMLAGMPVRRGWTASEHLEFNIRHNFLFVAVPLGLILLSHAAIAMAATKFHIPPVYGGAMRMAAVAAVFFFSPVLLVGVWRTHELQNGPLRERLDALCDRIGMKYRKILIWDTAGVLANAAVMGMHRSVRYIMISDALMEQLTDDQLVSVFGHEAGHVKFGHLWKFVLFILAMSLVCGSMGAFAGEVALRATASSNTGILVEEIVMTVSLGLLFWQGFGRLSRLLERQSDVYGAECAALDAEIMGRAIVSPDGMITDGQHLKNLYGSRVFASALDSIARINGMPRDGKNWRHGSIAHRVRFLSSWGSSSSSPKVFHESVKAVGRIIFVMLAAGIVGLALTWDRWT